MRRLCLLGAEHAVRHARHETLGIPIAAWPLVVQSWERAEPSLYGRMDLRWDGSGAPQLLEYNADTPTALYEAAVVQWDWLRTVLAPPAASASARTGRRSRPTPVASCRTASTRQTQPRQTQPRQT